MNADRRARLALCAVSEPGNPRLAKIVEEHGAEATWAGLLRGEPSTGIAARAQALDVDGVVEQTRLLGARFVAPGDEEWPDQLEVLAEVEHGGMGGAPLGLWLRGELRGPVAPGAVAVVGSRAATPYGLATAFGLGADLARQGRVVVSGGALGIDAEAHRGCLADGGVTVCVLASGVDQLYPPRNEALLRRVAAQGLLISESPPGSRPTRPRFLARNRLIAGLASGTVIVEGAARSGACNTISWAAACSRIAMAVPGPVESSLSVAPHRFIRERVAELVTSGAEIESLLAPVGQAMLVEPVGEKRGVDTFTPAQRQVFEAVPARGGRAAADIAQRAGIGYLEAVVALSELEGQGWLASRADGTYGLAGRRASAALERPA